MIHYSIVIILIVVIICLQLYVYMNTRNKIKEYSTILPSSLNDYELEEMSILQISINNKNETSEKIENALNMYLRKNQGAASDFHLMKDVVERYCDSKEEEVNIQQPIPLYLGLMGTMIGIIIGIGSIAISGGLSTSSVLNAQIPELMAAVAIAMIASFFGILCTTHLSWIAKSASTELESNKNQFYSWIQVELLPSLSGNTVTALHLLQQNLHVFNDTFERNIKQLDSALMQVTESATQQVELIALIKEIDIKRVAEANILVLKELKESSSEIATFNKYLHNVTEYLRAVNELNGNINEHLSRTRAIEKMGAFFEKELKQVKSREQYIKEVVANIDNTLQKSFNQLSESTHNLIANYRSTSISELDIISKQQHESKEQLLRFLNDQKEEFVNQLNRQYLIISETLKEQVTKNRDLFEKLTADQGQYIHDQTLMFTDFIKKQTIEYGEMSKLYNNEINESKVKLDSIVCEIKEIGDIKKALDTIEASINRDEHTTTNLNKTTKYVENTQNQIIDERKALKNKSRFNRLSLKNIFKRNKSRHVK